MRNFRSSPVGWRFYLQSFYNVFLAGFPYIFWKGWIRICYLPQKFRPKNAIKMEKEQTKEWDLHQKMGLVFAIADSLDSSSGASGV